MESDAVRTTVHRQFRLHLCLLQVTRICWDRSDLRFPRSLYIHKKISLAINWQLNYEIRVKNETLGYVEEGTIEFGKLGHILTPAVLCGLNWILDLVWIPFEEVVGIWCHLKWCHLFDWISFADSLVYLETLKTRCIYIVFWDFDTLAVW